jgi:serine/threonine protein kinase
MRTLQLKPSRWPIQDTLDHIHSASIHVKVVGGSCPCAIRYSTGASTVPKMIDGNRLALNPGVRLGPYEILSARGAGGMGEVYRARDTMLNREVAVKVLPEAFTRDPDRLARFKREAQVLASLNHPHIGAIYGFEDSGETHALVLALVEGDTLADRIARDPIPLDDALPIAHQICEALEAAHEQGIIHRDLKPSNIKITPNGAVKVLDFGLAKLGHPEAAAINADLTASPTITSPAMMTGVGVLLGTASYMAPEQAKGREADKRSDIWAFGCVLYEMLTGRRAFDGEDMTEVLGAVVRLEPNWLALPFDVPQPVRTLLQRCLVKDRRKRIADIAAALFVLDHQVSVAATSTSSPALLPHRPLWRRAAPLMAGALVVAALGAALLWSAMRPAPQRIVRTTIVTSGSAALALYPGGDRDIAITPDGSRIVYRGNNQLLVRALDQLEPTVLSGLGAPRGIFISPDGQWVGFSDGIIGLKKVAITGGSPVMIVPEGVSRGAPRGDRTAPSSSRRAPWHQDFRAYPREEARLPCSRSPIARAANSIISGPSSCLEAWRSSSRSRRPGATSTMRRLRCWIGGPARRRCSP